MIFVCFALMHVYAYVVVVICLGQIRVGGKENKNNSQELQDDLVCMNIELELFRTRTLRFLLSVWL